MMKHIITVIKPTHSMLSSEFKANNQDPMSSVNIILMLMIEKNIMVLFFTPQFHTNIQCKI